MLGMSLSKYLKELKYSVLSQGRRFSAECKFDPNNPQILSKFIDREEIGIIINLIALTNVDLCEKHVADAYHANSGVVEAIVNALEHCTLNPKPHLIQISTDQVYGGEGPHSEECIYPLNVYALSKYTGELLAKQVGATILRTNFYGISLNKMRKSFSDWAVQSLSNNMPITAFKDIKFSALHIKTLCSLICLIINQRPIGVYNVGCRDSISKAEFILELANLLNLPTQNLKIGTSKNLSLKALRPKDMSLKVNKIENDLNIRCPMIKNQIKETAKDYENEKIRV